MYIRIINNKPEIYSIEQLKHDNSNTSFPAEITNYILEQYNMFECVLTDMPDINHKYQKIEGNTISKVNDKWQLEWIIVEKTQDEINSWIASKAREIRQERNQLLLETDYLALSDNTLTPEMAEYRQKLRDITSQAEFPENVVWPIKPT